MSNILQGLNESLADDFMAMAREKGMNPRLRGTPEQERERTQQMLAQRAKDREMNPPQKPTLSPEQVQQLKQQLEKAEQGFDPNYEYSDDHSYWTQQKDKAQVINSIKRQLKDAGANLTEQKNYKNKVSIFESIGQGDTYFKKWEKEIHPILCEVALSQDQIQQLFKNVEQSAGRSTLGKGLDALKGAKEKISDVWFNKFGGMLQNSAPVKNFDRKFDKLKSDIAAKNPKLAASLAKYGEFAKNNPNLHKFLLAIGGSIAAALGVAAAGGIGAGALAVGTGAGVATGIINIADRLLQGQKLSTSVGRGATTGAIAGLAAGAAAKIGELVRAGISNDLIANLKDMRIVNSTMEYNGIPFSAVTKQPETTMLSKAFNAMKGNDADSVQKFLDILNKVNTPEYQATISKTREAALAAKEAAKSSIGVIKDLTNIATSAAGALVGGSDKQPSTKLSGQQLNELFGITGNKVDASSLMKAWKKAGSPTDSNKVAEILQNAGIEPTIVSQAMTSVGASAATAPTAPTATAATAATAAPSGAEPATSTAGTIAPKAPTVYRQVKDLLGQLDKRSKQRIIMTLKKDLQLAESGYRMSVYEILCELQLEGKRKPSKEVDYDDPEWDAMVKRVGQMAKEGPRKTVYDPVKKVYKTVPVNTPKKEEGVAEGLDAEAYKQKLLSSLPGMMRFFEKNVQGWRPSREQMLAAIETGYTVMKHTGDVKQAGRAVMDELNTLHRMSQGEQDVAEGKMAELEMDLEDSEITDRQFEKMYGMTRKEAREQFSQTDMWAFPEIRDPNRPLHERGVAEEFGPLPKDNQQIRLGRHTVDIERVGLDKNYISFAWHDSKGQEHYEEVAVGDLGSYDDLIKKIKQEISYQERKYTDQGVAEVSDSTKQSYKAKAQAQVKELEPHAKKGEYKDIAQRAIDRRTKGLARVK